MPDGRLTTSVVMLGLFAGMTAMALGFPGQAAFLPLLIGIPGTVLCAVQCALDLHQLGRARRTARCGSPGARAATPKDPSADRQGAARLHAMFAWLAIFTAVILALGLTIGGPLCVLAFLRLYGRESWPVALAAAAAALAGLWGIFAWLLELRLFEGLVVRWLA